MKRILSGPKNLVSDITEGVDFLLACNLAFFALDLGRDFIDVPLFGEELIWRLRQIRYETYKTFNVVILIGQQLPSFSSSVLYTTD